MRKDRPSEEDDERGPQYVLSLASMPFKHSLGLARTIADHTTDQLITCITSQPSHHRTIAYQPATPLGMATVTRSSRFFLTKANLTRRTSYDMSVEGGPTISRCTLMVVAHYRVTVVATSPRIPFSGTTLQRRTSSGGNDCRRRILFGHCHSGAGYLRCKPSFMHSPSDHFVLAGTLRRSYPGEPIICSDCNITPRAA